MRKTLYIPSGRLVLQGALSIWRCPAGHDTLRLRSRDGTTDLDVGPSLRDWAEAPIGAKGVVEVGQVRITVERVTRR